MSAFGRMHKATAVVPLAVLSAAWTASLVAVDTGTASAEGDPAGVLPDGTSVPVEAVEAPASVGAPVTRVASVEEVSASGIPETALAAYQRAEAVINKADGRCNLTWQLVAAIGRVESDHGRYGGNALDADGLARPGIYGIALDGTRNTQRILDTDGGAYDNDTRFDRAVGPMQFIPSTWSVVGVDGDGDGRRDPQDIDDAALATAVYLCSGDDDLSREQGQRASVYRYNHSNAYVDLVLEIMQAYLDGDFASVPNGTPSATLIPVPSTPGGGRGGGGNDGNNGGGDDKGDQSDDGGRGDQSDDGGNGGNDGGGNGTDDDGQQTPTSTPTATQTPTPTPTQNATPSPTPNPQPPTSSDPVPVPVPQPPTTSSTPPPVPVPVPPLPTATIPPPLNMAGAIAQCVADGVIDNPLTAVNELEDCAKALLAP